MDGATCALTSDYYGNAEVRQEDLLRGCSTRRFLVLTNQHPKRRVFYSFHFQRDAWRAAQVRNIGITEHDEPVSDNTWEQIRRRGNAAIQKWIDDQMATRSCVIVLIGSETASRQWVNYEIRKAWNDRKGLFGIYINRLLNQNRETSRKGINPFANVRLNDGSILSQYVAVYDAVASSNSRDVYAYISGNLEQWVERAITNRRQ